MPTIRRFIHQHARIRTHCLRNRQRHTVTPLRQRLHFPRPRHQHQLLPTMLQGRDRQTHPIRRRFRRIVHRYG